MPKNWKNVTWEISDIKRPFKQFRACTIDFVLYFDWKYTWFHHNIGRITYIMRSIRQVICICWNCQSRCFRDYHYIYEYRCYKCRIIIFKVNGNNIKIIFPKILPPIDFSTTGLFSHMGGRLPMEKNGNPYFNFPTYLLLILKIKKKPAKLCTVLLPGGINSLVIFNCKCIIKCILVCENCKLISTAVLT